MKKLLNVLLILAVLFTNLVPTTVLAAKGTNAEKGTLTIENTVIGETYSIYKMLDVLSYDTEKNIASYQITDEWLPFFTNTDKTYGDFTFSIVDGEDGTKLISAYDLSQMIGGSSEYQDFAKAALNFGKNLTKDSTTAVATTVVFENLDLGYYLVDTSVGTFCGLNTTTPNATIVDKHETTPDIEKAIVENGEDKTTTSVMIGDTITYSVVVSNIENLSNVKVVDTMEDGLTLNKNSITIKYNGELTTAVTATASEHRFEIVFPEEYLVGKTGEFTIEYSAVLNSNAEIKDVNGDSNDNTAKLSYGETTSITTETCSVFSYRINVVKTTETEAILSGAKFTLKHNNEFVKFVGSEEDGYTVSTLADATTTISAGQINIDGLEAGTYTLTETEAPEGYNKLGAPIEITINEDGSFESNYTIDETEYVRVINTTGIILPSTGGMGTVLFITVGSIMALGFGVNLVTKARMRKIED